MARSAATSWCRMATISTSWHAPWHILGCACTCLPEHDHLVSPYVPDMPATHCLQVGDELHHVPSGDVDNCCTRGCISGYKMGTIFNHGRVSVARQRWDACHKTVGMPPLHLGLCLQGLLATLYVLGAVNCLKSPVVPAGSERLKSPCWRTWTPLRGCKSSRSLIRHPQDCMQQPRSHSLQRRPQPG